MENEKIVTIFTPTFNRAYILYECYNSLKRQTNKNFKWLIIDDGSTDNTKEIVRSWINEGRIEIFYKFQENSGKYIAHNNGVLLCDTELFFCVDSDDCLTDDAVEKIIKVWNNIKFDDRIAGIAALKAFSSRKVIGTYMPVNVKTSSLFALYEKYKFFGDTALIYRTKILREYLFPVFHGEKFVTEAFIYDRIDKIYKLWLLNEIIYIGEYLTDGYSRNIHAVHKKSPKAYKEFLMQRINMYDNFLGKYKSCIRYLNWCVISNQKYDVFRTGHFFCVYYQ